MNLKMRVGPQHWAGGSTNFGAPIKTINRLLHLVHKFLALSARLLLCLLCTDGPLIGILLNLPTNANPRTPCFIDSPINNYCLSLYGLPLIVVLTDKVDILVTCQ